MSIPVPACLVVKATHDDEAYEEFKRRMKINMERGGFTQLPCSCDPPCECSDEALDQLAERLTKDLENDHTT